MILISPKDCLVISFIWIHAVLRSSCKIHSIVYLEMNRILSDWVAILTQICLQLWLEKEIKKKKKDTEISSPLFPDMLQHFITKAQLTHFCCCFWHSLPEKMSGWLIPLGIYNYSLWNTISLPLSPCSLQVTYFIISHFYSYSYVHSQVCEIHILGQCSRTCTMV